MSNLTRFKTTEGIELVIDQYTGEAFATISGYARMSGRDKSTISRRMETVAGETKKTAEIQTTQGLRTVALIPAKLVFKWLMKDNPDLAEKMGECGATVYLHQLAGFKVTSAAIAPKPIQPTLPPDERVSNLANALQFFDLDIQNPRFKQGYQDLVQDILGVGQPVLPQSRDRWLGVAERAEELGYAPKLVVKYRSQLGKWIKSHGLTFKQEKRLCNGTHRLVNLYLMCDELDELIHEYMGAKLPQAL